ncbi:MAG: DUF87 domain-containing protein [Burkholderiales bacterium]
MTNVFANTVLPNKLLQLLGDFKTNHVGYVYSMHFSEALILTNDSWKERVAGIPHNSFLVAAAFDPNDPAASASEFDREVLLLRVLGPSNLPSDADLVRTRIEHNQRRGSDDKFPVDERDGYDPITQDELQYGGLNCRILGTFFLEDGDLRLGSDLENYFASSRLRVYKPRAAALETIVNHINPEKIAAMAADAKALGFSKTPSAIQIGTVRYTSTARLHRGPQEPRVKVLIQPSDFLSRRTAVLGMTRTGKSNTVKTTVASVAVAAKLDGVSIGQIIFDLNGEYANATVQDDGSSIAAVFGADCVRYRAADTKGFEDLRINFYEEPAQGLALIVDLFRKDPPPYSGQDLDTFLGSTLEEPERTAYSDHTRWEVLCAVWRCLLFKANFKAPASYLVTVPQGADLVKQITRFAQSQTPPIAVKVPTADRVSLEAACEWFETLRKINLQMRAAQKSAGEQILGIESTTKGNSWVSTVLEAYLNMLARENTREQAFGGYRAIAGYSDYHSPKRAGDVVREILAYLHAGKIVILDLTVGPPSVRTVLSKKIAQSIFNSSMKTLNEGKMPPNVVVYVEEAHNLIGKKDDLTDTWPRLAKEGAKARIAFVYATQEPSSLHPNILANTENWFVTHLNNDDELKALGKFYDFADFAASLKSAQDVGFARIKTLSSPFVVPTQISRFTPAEIKHQLAQMGGPQAALGI